MSDTPRTDAELMSLHGKRLATGWYVTGDFARQLERELEQLKAALADHAEVELAMIRGDIAIPDRVEFDGIRETKNQTETAMLKARPFNDSPDVNETDFVNTTTACVCGFCDGTYCNHGT